MVTRTRRGRHGWHETAETAESLGLSLVSPAAATYECEEFDNSVEFWDYFFGLSQSAVNRETVQNVIEE